MILARAIAVVIGYLCGLLQTGYFYGKGQGVDIRTKGSGNAGTTNSLRVLGVKAGAITLTGDCIKAIIAVVITHFLFRNLYPDGVKLLEIYAGFGAVLGHNFPFYLKFKGGKGIACTAGVIISLCPWWFTLLCLIVFILIVAITRYVSLGSIVIVLLFLAGVFVCNQFGMLGVAENYVIEFDIVAVCFTAMALWRHRANIRRLVQGTENKFSFKK